MKVIFSVGGDGTSVFPLARTDYPKGFLKIFDNTSLFLQNVMRFTFLVKQEDMIVITNQQCEYYVRNELITAGLDKVHIIIQPVFRDTLPLIALAVNYCKTKLNCREDETIIISNTNTLISPNNVFLRNLKQGLEMINKDKIVLFGMKPQRIDTSYGYIKIGDKFASGYLVDSFKEKPDYSFCKQHWQDKTCYWNSGMYLFQAHTFWQQLQNFVPEAMSVLEKPYELLLQEFGALPAISLKCDFLGKIDNLSMIILNCFCDDINSLDNVYEIMNKDFDGNATNNDNALIIECKNSLFISSKRLLTGIGLEDLLVVESDDVVLVAKKGQSDKVQELLQLAKEQNRPEPSSTNIVGKHWGYYTILEKAGNYIIRRVVILPGMSMQEHLNETCSEHWVVTSGCGKVIIDDKEIVIEKNQSTFVPAKTRHSIINTGTEILELIEVQNE